MTSLAARHAIEALHALVTHLPTSRDLILATGAVAKLVALLRDSLLQAHYSMLKVDMLPLGSHQQLYTQEAAAICRLGTTFSAIVSAQMVSADV